MKGRVDDVVLSGRWVDVEVADDEHVGVYRVEARLGRDLVGWAQFERAGQWLDPFDPGASFAVYVVPEQRRRGLASRMHEYAEHKTGLRVGRSREQTPDGAAFREAFLCRRAGS